MSFTDPVVRCTECQTMIFRDQIYEFGCCPKCGNRRVRNVLNMSPEERDEINNKGFGDFLELFEEVEIR